MQDVGAIQHILRDNSVAYDKNFSLYDRVKLFLGDGLLLQTGEAWRKRRKLSQPYFTHHSMPHVFHVALDKSQQMVQRWRIYAHQRVAVNLGQELASVMLQIAAEALFSTCLSFEEALHLVSLYAKTQRYVHRAISMHRWFPSIAQWRARYGSAQLKRAIDAIIHDHISQRPPDMLDSFLAATECPLMNLAKNDIRDELQTFLGGGHETTTSGFLWTMVQLLQHPHYVELLQKEIDHVLPTHDFVYEDLESLSLTKMIFQEGLRLYPPVWITARRLLEPDVLCGYSIPKETIVSICLYSLHRDLRHWIDP
ncbi:MAG: cytochrome P450, partial [Gammaproteobacteria bacterium]|nr:cytochrome P450 [Gammaproteobacteria bacterium]